MTGTTHIVHHEDTEGPCKPEPGHRGREQGSNYGRRGDLMAHDGVYLPETLTMARSAYARLWVLLDTMMGRYHPSAHGMDAFMKDLMERETYLEE